MVPGRALDRALHRLDRHRFFIAITAGYVLVLGSQVGGIQQRHGGRVCTSYFAAAACAFVGAAVLATAGSAEYSEP